MITNPLKEKIRGGEVVLGSFLFMPSPNVMEIFGYAGFDFAIIDTEHGPTGYSDTVLFENIVRAAEVSGITPLVRIPERSRVATQKVLDAGAMGIVVAMIESAQEVRDAVADAKYPPTGSRGGCYLTRPTRYTSAFTPDYWRTANEAIMVVPMIETQKAVEKLDEILAVPGIDFLFFGTRDYSLSCGYPTPDNEETREAILRVNEICARRGVKLARFLYPPYEKTVKKAIEEGFNVLVVGGDIPLLYTACRDIVRSVRG